MSIIDLVTNDSSAALVAAVFTFATAIVSLIGSLWVSNRKKNGTGHQAGSHRTYIQNLQSDKSRLIGDLTKAIEEREKLTAEVARLTAENTALRTDLAVMNRKVEVLFKAINRLDPNVLKAFGSDFVPL